MCKFATMTLLKRFSNSELREVFEEALLRADTNAKLQHNFGQPPYHFLEGRTGPVARYRDFQPKYVDRLGRQYSELEEGQLGVRIPIAVRRENPTVEFPQDGETLRLISLSKFAIREVYVISLQINPTRRSTAWLEIGV